MLANNQSFLLHCSQSVSCPTTNINSNSKRKRRPAGTPDPNAEVVYLSPETLMESDRYICELCNQCFQREQNLQMHRRRHKVPWKLVKRDKEEDSKKRVYVCPEPTCLHHNPLNALGDLVGIKKHFRRKHSNQKDFVCLKCSKGYAVQSDYKAHLKICGTKGHSCDCGRVFSRVESFIEHQDRCKARTENISDLYQAAKPTYASQVSPRSCYSISQGEQNLTNSHHNLDLGLQLFPSENYHNSQENEAAIIDQSFKNKFNIGMNIREGQAPSEVSRLRNEASQLMKMAMEQKALAEKKRKESISLLELAKHDMENASIIRKQVQEHDDDDEYAKAINCSNYLQHVACHACNKRSQETLILEGIPQPMIANFSSSKKYNPHEAGRKERGFPNLVKESYFHI